MGGGAKGRSGIEADFYVMKAESLKSVFRGDDALGEGVPDIEVRAIDDVRAVGEVWLSGDRDGVARAEVFVDFEFYEFKIAGDVAGGGAKLEDEVEGA